MLIAFNKKPIIWFCYIFFYNHITFLLPLSITRSSQFYQDWDLRKFQTILSHSMQNMRTAPSRWLHTDKERRARDASLVSIPWNRPSLHTELLRTWALLQLPPNPTPLFIAIRVSVETIKYLFSLHVFINCF